MLTSCECRSFINNFPKSINSLHTKCSQDVDNIIKVLETEKNTYSPFFDNNIDKWNEIDRMIRLILILRDINFLP